MRNLALAMQVLKQRVSGGSEKEIKKNRGSNAALETGPPAFWQKRYYDFNVFSQANMPRS
jgi:hypothetical protein